MTESKRKVTHGGFHRRAFLKGSGAVAAATALQTEVASAVQQTTQVAKGRMTIDLEVNGKRQTLEVETRDTLLDVLRYQLDLTGAKPVSLDGSSGASTVLLDGKPIMASTALAVACDGKRVTTVEGLDDTVPAAFVAADAQQCGFCTPGFVVAVKAFLDKNPNASETAIREGLNGNICRCGTYSHVIQAAVSLVKGGSNG
ncbi:MAG TPA: (2Fe-2S)-binding protein [Planctomycetes bacterium]|nr:(2Fe-2S)-binding protein [Planctomycetaceae bacterium]HIM29041.1 (2Fe-2S)-binding protein [Planctomycetota bacterium]